ncbi:helix-turn-helix transcriptional regulator [Erwiniaceae bacterium L1_55_4]|nr:helix-turn-helix transcriptional regulator [Erwiniaceae bacterium L1_55_4]
MESIAERIKNKRKKLKMSQRELADLVGIKQQSIHQIESGLTKKPKFLFEIAVALNCEISWLLTGTSIHSSNGEQNNKDQTHSCGVCISTPPSYRRLIPTSKHQETKECLTQNRANVQL